MDKRYIQMRFEFRTDIQTVTNVKTVYSEGF